MKKTLFLSMLAITAAAAAQDVFLELHSDPVEKFFGVTAFDKGSADSVTITCPQPLNMTEETKGMVTIIGASNYDWEYEDNTVGNVQADIVFKSVGGDVQVRGVENLRTPETSDIDVNISSLGKHYKVSNTAAYFVDDYIEDRQLHSVSLSLDNADLGSGRGGVATLYLTDIAGGTQITIDSVSLHLQQTLMGTKEVAPIIIETDMGAMLDELHVGDINLSLSRGSYGTVYADGILDKNETAIDIGNSTVTLQYQAKVNSLKTSALDAVDVVMNGGSIEASEVTIAHADIIGGVNALRPQVETLSIDGNVILREKVTVNDSYEIAEGSHINAIGMGTENGYARVTAGTAYQLIAAEDAQGEISGATAGYGDIQGKLEARKDGLYVTFDATETGNVYYVLNDTDAAAVEKDLRPGAQHVALLAEMEMNTSLSGTDITVTDAGSMIFKHNNENSPCTLDGQLTLGDGAQLVFDFTPSEMDADTPLLTYTGGSINHSGTTFITLIVGENWEQGCTDVYELATGLGSLGNVHINVSPADRDTVTYLGEAYIRNGTLYYGNTPDPVPEPATATLSLLALAALAARRKRK